MKRMEFPLVGGTGGYLGYQFDPRLTINMFIAQIDALQLQGLISIPGTLQVFENGMGDNTRSLYDNVDNLFGIFADQVVILDENLSPVTLGTLGTTTGYVGVTENNSKQIMWVDNVNGWVYDYSTGLPTFTQITDPFFTSISGPVDCDFLDGFMIVGFSSNNQWIISNINDATTYNALNFAFLTSDGNERITGIRVINRQIFIFGRTVTEVWYNAANVGNAASGLTFPFQRNNNVVMQFGCAATGSIAVGSLTTSKLLPSYFLETGSVLVWLASQKDGSITIRITNGSDSRPISDDAINYRLEQLTTPSDARAYIFSIEGHSFYLINFLTDNLTLVYDFASDMWHEQQMIDENNYFSICHSFYKGRHILGHKEAAKLSVLSPEYATNNGEPIHCVRQTPIFALPTQERTIISRVQLEQRQGTGKKTTDEITTAQYSKFNLDPKIYLSHSSDGGYKYSQQRPQGTGKVGETEWVTAWTAFPMATKHNFRLESFNAVRQVWIKLSVIIQDAGY